MKKLLGPLLILLAIGAKSFNTEREVTATVYHAVEGQTDSTPLITASGFNINPINPMSHRIIAISRNLEKDLCLSFGDYVYVDTPDCAYEGIWRIEDRMNRRFTNKIDFLVNKDVLNKFNCNITKIKL